MTFGVTVQAQTVDKDPQAVEQNVIAVPQQYIDEFGVDRAAAEYQSDLILMAKLTWHEAGNQDLTGKRLVCDTVLYRMESGLCGRGINTIREVIFQPGQFTTASQLNYYNDECLQAVMMEVDPNTPRVDNNVFFFGCYGYSYYGHPAFKYGGHYFSYY